MAPSLKIKADPGTRFGRLTVLEDVRLPNTPGRQRHGFREGSRGALCRCDCGNEVAVALTRLKSGNTRSCGCLRVETAKKILIRAVEANTTHGLSKRYDRAMYNAWRGMMQRCYNPAHHHYRYYGGRGITVDDRWHDVCVFVADIAAQLGPRPAGYTLDRIDNDGPYTAGNVRWADRQTQSRNRRQPRTKLSASQLSGMRAMRSTGAVLREIAETYGVSIATAHRLTTPIPPGAGLS